MISKKEVEMKIVGLNQDIVWKDKEANFSLITNAFAGVDADIFVLPEMFATGFCMEPHEIADRNEESLTFLKKLARDKNAAVCGSASISENGGFYNRMYFVFPDGAYTWYDKRHLFSFSGENKVYKKGKKRVLVSYKGWRILLQVCYDLRFPVFSRNEDDYDLVLYVANWPEKRVEAWQHLLKARAIENLSYVFGLNRIGRDGNGLHYKESSHCFFADGKSVEQKIDNLVVADLIMEDLQKFRNHFQFLQDRDDFRVNF